MGAVVSREHAKLPFAYSHARQEDHSHASSTTKRRLASRLLLHRSPDSNTTSVTPFPVQDDFMGIAHGMGLGGAYGGGVTIGGFGAESSFGGPGTGNDMISLSLILAGSPTTATFGNAEVVSLSSMLDQGPESASEFDPSESREGSMMDLEEALGAFMGGSVGGLDSSTPGVIRDSDSGHQRSIRSRSATVSSIRSYGFPRALSVSAEAAIFLSTPNGEDVIEVGFDALTKPSLVQAETTLNAHDELSNISILAADKMSSMTTASDTNGTEISIVSQSPPPPLSLDQSPLSSLKSESMSALPSWIAEYHLEADRTKDQKAAKETEYDHDMDIISALGIADMPEGWCRRDNRITLVSALATTPPNPQKPYPRLSIDEEDCCVAPLSNNTSWMDQEEYDTIVHIPQDFFGHGRQFQQGHDLDEDEDDEMVHGESHGGLGMGGRSNSFSYLTGLDDHLAPFVDEEVSHLSPIPFTELPSLTNIGLCSHGIVKLSANIRLLGSTTCLQLVPKEIGYLRNLTLLDLSKNSLTCIPDTIQHLGKLVDLKLSFNFLESLPSTIGHLSKLAGLALDNNRLERIPPQIGMIKGLVTLDLSDNPIQVLPAEIGRLQLLRSLKLDRCPLIDKFSHSPLHSPPTLLELAARVIVRHDLKVPTILPSHLKTYLKTAQRCTFCEGPFFESWCKRGKIIEKNDHCIPLEYTLCHPHWNTEMERVRLLFCPRPPTSPPPPPVLPTPSTSPSGNSGPSESTSRRRSKSGPSQSAATASSSSTVVATASASPVAASPGSLQGQHYPASASSASLSSSSLHWRARSDVTAAAGSSTPTNAADSTPRSRASTSWIRSVSHSSSTTLASASFSTPPQPPYVLPPNSAPMSSSSSSSAARSRFSLLMKARDKKRQATTP
ncbi:hypothetical protein BG006_007440 [Podila minutissima]|uniref:L domain-like protein n=1 Tax=Podila minutissima TaxID=64525 RepID=A0A9P5VQE5_9FUNG|nr:hypothetical protein BG006_007440 [Podila minutissima]